MPNADDFLGEAPKQSAHDFLGSAPAAASSADPQYMSRLEQFGTGLKDPIQGGAQLATHLLPAPVVQAGNRVNNWLADKTGLVGRLPEGGIDQQTKEREADIKAHTDPQMSGLYRAAGSALATTPLAIATGGVGGPVVGGIAAGTATSVLDPVASDDYWRKKAEQGAVGGATGGVVGVGAKLLGGMFHPDLNSAAKRLMDAGVDLTPGQMSGMKSITRTAEEATRSLPITGTAIRGAEDRALEGFNRASADLALEPIGAKVPKGLTGTQIIAYGQDALEKAYKNVLSGVTMGLDNQFVNDLIPHIQRVQQYAAPDDARAFGHLMQNELINKAQPNGVFTGETLNKVQSELRVMAERYNKSELPSHQAIGGAIDEVREMLLDNLARYNPQIASDFQDVRRAYARFVPVSRAAARRPTADATFTPADLLQMVKSQDNSSNKRQFAAGAAGIMQDWGSDAYKILGTRLRDSGTTERSLWDRPVMEMGKGAAETSLAAFIGLPKAALGLGVLSAPYTAPAQRFMNNQFRNAGPLRTSIADLIRQYGPLGAPVAADYVNQKTNIPTMVIRPDQQQ